jgi:hypothetical protein
MIAINENGLITPTCEQIIDTGGSTLDIWFDVALSGLEESVLDGVLAAWECPPIESPDDFVTNRVYNGHFLITGSGIQTISGIPFEPNQIQFRATYPVYAGNLEENTTLNSNDDGNYAGFMYGYVRDDGAGVTQQVSHTGGSGASINSIRYASSSSNCVLVSAGNNDGVEVSRIEASFSQWNSDGFDINVTTFNSVENSGLLVFFTATRDQANLEVSTAVLNDIANVSANPNINDVLTFDGTGWIAQAPSSAVVFGSEFQETSSEGTSATTSGTFQEKLSMTTTNLPLGKYRIGWTCETVNSSTSGRTEVRVQLNNTITLGQPGIETEDDEDWVPFTGYKYETFSGVQQIDIDYRVDDTAATASIRRARLELWRVS